MNPTIPGFLFPYILCGTLATMAALLFGLNRSLKLANLSTQDRGRAVWSAVALLTAFYIAALIPARLGFYRGSPPPVPAIQYAMLPMGLLTPIIVGILLFLWWRPLRRIVEAVPQQWLVGLQLYRTLGIIFLILYSAGRLPAQFAWPAGAGDVLVGLLAPLVAIAHTRKWRHANALVLAWNLFGIADLVGRRLDGLPVTKEGLMKFLRGSVRRQKKSDAV